MKVALVHDYLVNKGGAERVVAVMHSIWPDAPIFTALYNPETTFEDFAGADIRTSSLQRMLGDPAAFRRFLPLFGGAFERMNIEGFDATICSTAGFAHFVTPRDGCLISYCHTPPRFLWDDRYDHAGVAPRWARPVLPLVLDRMRKRDRTAADRVHVTIANSRFIQQRIQDVYRKRSFLIPPPIEVDRFRIGARAEDHYLMVGRLLPHRNMHLTVEAFTRMGRRLIVVGDGPLLEDLRAMAGPTVTFAGSVDNATIEELYASCRGVVVAGEEDFGMVPLEANAAGRPVVALGRGGALETVVDTVTGILFDDETVESVIEAVGKADLTLFDALVLRRHAENFSVAAFTQKLMAIVEATSECLECARAKAGS